jgi:hypothetical protein
VYETIILLIILCGYETLSLTLKEKHREEVTAVVAYHWDEQVKENELDCVCGTHEREEQCHRDLVVRSEQNSPFGRPSCRCNETIEICLKYDGTMQTVFYPSGDGWTVVNGVMNL